MNPLALGGAVLSSWAVPPAAALILRAGTHGMEYGSTHWPPPPHQLVAPCSSDPELQFST